MSRAALTLRLLALPTAALMANPAAAQDHSQHQQHGQPGQHQQHGQHTMPDMQPQAQPEPEIETEQDEQPEPDHTPIDHSQMDHGTMDHGNMDHSQMDHSQMDHSQMDHSGMAMPIDDIPPPAAGTGPARAADAIWGAEAMRASREQLKREQGGQTFASFRADRFEYRARDGRDGFLWDVDAWYGGDIDKLWLKSEGEGAFGEGVEDAEVQALWSHAISPWFDLQTGIRQDLTGPERTYAVLGLQGLAPYLFHVDGTLFLSSKGDLTAKAEAELDQRITQRLIIQPRTEVTLAAQDVPELGIGTGIDGVEAGVRLRYEIVRELAPYIGIAQEWKLGGSADYARAAGEDTSSTNFVVGLRFWF